MAFEKLQALLGNVKRRLSAILDGQQTLQILMGEIGMNLFAQSHCHIDHWRIARHQCLTVGNHVIGIAFAKVQGTRGMALHLGGGPTWLCVGMEFENQLPDTGTI